MPEPDSPPPVGRWEATAIAAILAVYLAALVFLAWRVGVTIDEPSHLLSAHFYWQGKDQLEPRDMPPVIKIAAGWVPGWFRLPIPYDHPVWKTRHEWFVSMEMLQRMNQDEIRRLFFFSRLPLIIFPLLTAALVWWWGRQLFSPGVGVVLAVIYSLEPTAMGHGALFKNDIAATFGFLSFWYRGWRFYREPVLRNAVWLAGALLLAILSKMSMLVLLAAAPVVLLAGYWPIRKAAVRPLVLSALFVFVIVYAGALAAYQFETRRIPAAEMAALSQAPWMPGPIFAAIQVFRVLPLPRPLWQGGLSLLQSNAGETANYAFGEVHDAGNPFYFLVALALKVPVPLQALLLGGIVLLGVSLVRGQLSRRDLFWIVPPALYVTLASISRLQLGVRLVLPALPLALLAVGFTVRWLSKGRRAAVLVLLIAWMGATLGRVYPQCISFFNIFTGNPANGWRLLSDSNLDWGQNLPDLADVVRSRGIQKLTLSYFGTDNPYAYLRNQQLQIHPPPPWNPERLGVFRWEPPPGIYAVSASLLTGQFLGKTYRDYFDCFRRRTPIARAGYSIYIYEIK